MNITPLYRNMQIYLDFHLKYSVSATTAQYCSATQLRQHNWPTYRITPLVCSLRYCRSVNSVVADAVRQIYVTILTKESCIYVCAINHQALA
uniref:Ovule protein n=1 Tax=Steinernema glaseri TaxID=37863 RepID=A0A1I7YWJ2_9BILA